MPSNAGTTSGRSGWYPVLHVVLLLPPTAFVVSTLPGVRGHSGYDLVLDGVLNNLAYACAPLVCLLRAHRSASPRTGSHLLAAGLAIYGSGNVLWTLFVRPLADPPYPSMADASFLTCYPFVFAALIVLAKRRDGRHAHSLWLDGVVGGLAVSAVAAAAVIGPIVESTTGSWAAIATTTAYPLLDLVLLLVVTAVLSLFGWRPPVGLWLLVAGLVLFVVADVAYLFGTARGTYVSGGPGDGVWVLGVVLMGLTPGWSAAPTGFRLPGWALLAIPVVSTAGALVILVADHTHPLHPVAVGLAAATVGAALVRLLVTFREVTSLAGSEQLALTDELTGLGNRRALYRYAPQLIGAAGAPVDGAQQDAPRAVQVALLLLDLDGFKEVNDSLGHHAGDVLLRGVGARLQAISTAAGATAVRLGGDEFALLLVDVTASAAEGVAQAVHEGLQQPLEVDGITVRVRASVGIAVLPARQSDLPDLLRQADVAMYRAKTQRLGTFTYTLESDEFASGDRLATVELLRAAIADRSLVLHYQPKVDGETRRVHSVEALVRWDHPTRGLLYPDAFLPLVKGAGLMDDLTRAVLDQALAQAHAWDQAGHPFAVAVNLSAGSLGDTALPQRIEALLADHRVPAQLLEIEITEDFLMVDPQRARTILEGLRALGIRIAVDDYGTGYSSLAYLRQLPIDDLKLDKSFLTDLTGDPRALAIVRSTIMLAHSLGLRLVAEGVEDEDTARELTDAGCDVHQGWHYSKALPAQELPGWVDRHHARYEDETAATT